MILFDIIRRYKWDLGIACESEGHYFDNKNWKFHIIKAPRDRWYADPFILDVTDDYIYVLVEELEHKVNKGRIAKLTIDKNSYKVRERKVILELSTHLSFPAILRDADNVFIYPENSESGSSLIYKYDIIGDEMVPVSLLSTDPLTDAVMFKYADMNYLISTKVPEQNGSIAYVYQSADKISGYAEVQQIRLNDNTARSAGDVFSAYGKTIRPAQNCNGGYGVGLVFQELIRKADGTFSLNEIIRHNPPAGYVGMHTYNSYKGYTIVDLHSRRYPSVYKVLNSIKIFLNLKF